jgi:hypothetical protein
LSSLVRTAVDAALLTAALAAAALAVYNDPRWNFATRDVIVYSIAADMWSHGAVPYRDFIDHKPPAAYLAYRTFFALGGRSPRAIWQGMTCLAAIAALSVYLGLRLTGRAAAAVAAAAALFFLIVTDTLDLGLEAQNNCETLATFWAALAFAGALAYERCSRAPFAALAGICMATAVLSKQTAACWLLPLAVHLATARWAPGWQQRARSGARALLWFAAGGTTVVALCLAYFAAHGALGPFYEWVIARNLVYARPSSAPPVLYHWWVLIEAYRWILPKLTGANGLPFALALLALPLAALARQGYLARLAILWWASSVVGVSAGLGIQSHYVLLLALPLALGLGAALEWPLGFLPVRFRIAALEALLAAGLCAFIFGPSADDLRKLMRGDATMLGWLEKSSMYRLGRDVANGAAPGDRMLAFGDPFDALFYSGLRPPGRYIYYPNAALQPDPEDYMREVRATQPRFIYIGADTYGAFETSHRGVQGMLRRYLDENYEPWLQGGGGMGRVYRRVAGGEAGSDRCLLRRSMGFASRRT